jgi:hypothetical protein
MEPARFAGIGAIFWPKLTLVLLGGLEEIVEASLDLALSGPRLIRSKKMPALFWP